MSLPESHRVYGVKPEPGEKKLPGYNVWFCDVCDSAFRWHDDSRWYGSDLDLENEDYDKMTICCSRDCVTKAKQRRLF